MLFMGSLTLQNYILDKNKVRVIFLTETEIDISMKLYPHLI